MSLEYVDSFQSWMVALYCCGLNFLTVGVFKISGLLFVEMMSHFEVSRERASFPFFLCSITRSLAGPVGGYLGHLYGLGVVMALGSVISSLGIGACFFARDMVAMDILWGVVVGFGFGLTLLLTPQAVNIYFKKHLFKGMGILVSGASIGGLVLSPIMDYCSKMYSLSGAFLILGGITLHGIPLSLMVKNPEIRKQRGINKDLSEDSNCSEIVEKNGRNGQNIVSEAKRNLCNNEFKITKEGNGLVSLQTQSPRYRRINDEIINIETNHLNPLSNQQADENSYEDVSTSESAEVFSNEKRSAPNSCYKSNDVNKQIKSDNVNSVLIQSLSKSYETIPVTIQPEHSRESTVIQKGSFKALFLYQFKIFLNISYIIVALSYSCSMVLSLVFDAVIVDASLDKGITKTNSLSVLMIFCVSDLLARLLVGFITDRTFMTRTNYGAITFFVAALSALSETWASDFAGMVVVAVLQGSALGALFAITPGLLSVYVEKDQQTVAVASSSLLLIPFSITMPTVIGYFRDKLGSYNLLMYLMTVIALINAIFLVSLPFLEQWKTRKREAKKEVKE